MLMWWKVWKGYYNLLKLTDYCNFILLKLKEDF